MPASCCRTDYDAIFNDRAARRDLAAYRRNGPTGGTLRLIRALQRVGVEGARVLDIGGGVGVIGHELLAAGAAQLTDVDASRAYLAAARLEAERRGFGDQASFVNADFVEIADDVEAADIVTLDRVLCCYGDWTALVDRSVAHARRAYGLVYPVERRWLRFGARVVNLGLRLFRQSFRFQVHPERLVDARIRAAGFEAAMRHRGPIWQTVVYVRDEGPSVS